MKKDTYGHETKKSSTDVFYLDNSGPTDTAPSGIPSFTSIEVTLQQKDDHSGIDPKQTQIRYKKSSGEWEGGWQNMSTEATVKTNNLTAPIVKFVPDGWAIDQNPTKELRSSDWQLVNPPAKNLPEDAIKVVTQKGKWYLHVKDQAGNVVRTSLIVMFQLVVRVVQA